MRRTCLLSLVLYSALSVAYFVWIDSAFDPPGTYIGALVAAFATLCSLGALINAWTAWRTISLLASSESNSPLRDGRLVAVAGTIHPLGKPLTAPFSGAECVVCEYDLSTAARATSANDESNPGSDLTGFLMVPCVIRARQGDVRLLGFPVMEGFEAMVCRSYSAAHHAQIFLRSTNFEDRTGLKIASLLSVFGEVWSDDDGQVDKNLRLRKMDPEMIFPPGSEVEIERLMQWESKRADDSETEDEDFDDSDLDDSDLDLQPKSFSMPRMVEKRVDPGEEVCAVGIFRETRRGLLPSPGSRHINRLLRGSADGIRANLRGQVLGNLAGGLVALAFVHVLLYGLIKR